MEGNVFVFRFADDTVRQYLDKKTVCEDLKNNFFEAEKVKEVFTMDENPEAKGAEVFLRLVKRQFINYYLEREKNYFALKPGTAYAILHPMFERFKELSSGLTEELYLQCVNYEVLEIQRMLNDEFGPYVYMHDYDCLQTWMNFLRECYEKQQKKPDTAIELRLVQVFKFWY